MRTRCVTIDGRFLNEHDRRILKTYAEQEVGTHGDVHLEATKTQTRHLNELLDMILPELPPPASKR